MTKTNQPQKHISYWEKPILFMANKVKEDHPDKPLALYFKEHEQGGCLYVAPEGSNLAKNGQLITPFNTRDAQGEEFNLMIMLILKNYRESGFPENVKVLIPIDKLDKKQPIKELIDSFDNSEFVFYNIAVNRQYIEWEHMDDEGDKHFLYKYHQYIQKDDKNNLRQTYKDFLTGYLLKEIMSHQTMTLHEFIYNFTDNIEFLSSYLEKTIFTSNDYSIAYGTNYSDCHYETGLLLIKDEKTKETEPLPQNIQWTKDGFRFEALVEKFQKPITYMLSQLGDETSPDELNLMYDFHCDYLILAYEAPSEFTPSLILGSVPTSLAKTNPYEAFEKLLQQTDAKYLHYWPECLPEFIIQSDLINQNETAKTVIDQIDDYKRLELSLIKKCFQQCHTPADEFKNQNKHYIIDDIKDITLLATSPFHTWVNIFLKHPYFNIPGIHFTPGGNTLGGRYDGIFE